MDESRFDVWTRRRAGLTLGGLVSAVLSLAIGGPGEVAAKKCKGSKKKCGKKCIGKNKCCGGCAGAKTCCQGACRNLENDGNHCGTCGNACVTGDCIHGACRCGEALGDCPAGCSCGAREEGGAPACFDGVLRDDCDFDDDCPIGSVCLVNNKCSRPCLA